MNKIKNIVALSLLLALGITTGCDEEFVNTKPLDQVSEADVWVDPGLSEAFVTEIYNGFGLGGFDEQMLASATDEAIFTHPGRNINTITESRVSPENPGWTNNTRSWGSMYSRIRATNLALENLADPLFEDPELVERLNGEAHFLRAYFYHQLLRYFGGVPIIEDPYELGEPDYSIARNTFEECVNFIVAECDAAAQMLEGKSLADGRASQAAALALKARVLLYAASDLHDIPTASANSSVISGYSNSALLGYTSGDQTARWQAAQAAAKAVLDITDGYMTDLTEPVSAEEGEQNYENISLSKNGGETELILGRYYILSKNEYGQTVGRANGPNGYHNWAGNTPTQNLVDDYQMMDGSDFDWDNPEHAAAPYENRDPRFYATVLYDGADWKPRTPDVAAKDPFNQIQTGTYEIMLDGEKVTYFGLDTRQSSVEDWNGTRTGYYMHKFINKDPTINDQNEWQEIPWPILRYTEVMLNYAEASIELGQDAEARTWLNKIRFRAGMPAITESGEALMEQYRNERRIELAYEEHRYHDARRWMIAEETLGEQVQIILVEGKLKPGANVTLYKYDPENYDYTYTVTDLDPGFENREWLDKMYFLPIQRDEMNRNAQLVQNPGY
uniref:RagB/SusD family nutrient uptake outer membrane protein n=1 Tax=Roseihalotalea indica TaxID=2867963 RepID=A0AA49JED9_9BACT|nr:RagB/SusD family nutrient uptake outer membrane protein [Tunicatimonas sp. TK19036]